MKSWRVGPDHIFPGTPSLFAPPARKNVGWLARLPSILVKISSYLQQPGIIELKKEMPLILRQNVISVVQREIKDQVKNMIHTRIPQVWIGYRNVDQVQWWHWQSGCGQSTFD